MIHVEIVCVHIGKLQGEKLVKNVCMTQGGTTVTLMGNMSGWDYGIILKLLLDSVSNENVETFYPNQFYWLSVVSMWPYNSYKSSICIKYRCLKLDTVFHKEKVFPISSIKLTYQMRTINA